VNGAIDLGSASGLAGYGCHWGRRSDAARGIALQIAWFDAPDLRAPKAIAAQVQVRALETWRCVSLGQLFQPTASRSDIRDMW